MTRNTGTWGGRDVDRARALMATTLPTKCHTCPTIVRAGDAWVVHHIISRGEAVASGRPDLIWAPSNWAVQCRRCSNRSTQQGVIDKAKAEARAESVAQTPARSLGAPPSGES